MLNIVWRHPALQAWGKTATVKCDKRTSSRARYTHDTREWDFARGDMGKTVMPVHFTVTNGGAARMRLRICI